MLIAELIELWPDVRTMSDDLNVSVKTIYSWKRRGFLPPRMMEKVHQRADDRGLPLPLTSILSATRAPTEDGIPNAQQ